MLDNNKLYGAVYDRIIYTIVLHALPTLKRTIYGKTKLQHSILAQGNTITVLNSEGKEIELNANMLQAAAAQNAIGM